MGFSKPAALPSIMVAPNGARKTTSDHPAIPVTIEQTAITAKACFDAGAGAIHFHVRDTDQKHVLDAGFYREGLEELNRVVPDMSCLGQHDLALLALHDKSHHQAHVFDLCRAHENG